MLWLVSQWLGQAGGAYGNHTGIRVPDRISGVLESSWLYLMLGVGAYDSGLRGSSDSCSLLTSGEG